MGAMLPQLSRAALQILIVGLLMQAMSVRLPCVCDAETCVHHAAFLPWLVI